MFSVLPSLCSHFFLCIYIYIYIYIILCIYSWLCWVFAAAQVFLQLRREGAALLLQGVGSQPHSGFSCSSWALECTLRRCDARAWLLHSVRDLLRPGLQPVSPAQVGGIFRGQDSSPCLLHRWAGSLPVSQQGSPVFTS